MLRSRDRMFGTPNAFNVQMLDIPRGTYKVTFNLVTSDITPSELQVQWSGMQSRTTSKTISFKTVLVSGPLLSVATTQFIDPGNDVYIQFTDVLTGLLRINMPETVITCFFEQI